MSKIAAYDRDGIWGLGDTEEQARAEAEGSIRDMLPESMHEEEIGKLQTAPVSEALLAQIDALINDDTYKDVWISKGDLDFAFDTDAGELVPVDTDDGEDTADDADVPASDGA